MPRYAYRCDACDSTVTIQHLSDESVSDCPQCESSDSLVKQLTTFRTNTHGRDHKHKTGDTTEKFIQTSREELRLQKKDLEEQR